MSVSSSQGLTSSRMEDLATRAGFLDFLAVYSASRCSLILAASALSASSSEPNRSMSSSPLAFAGGGRRSATEQKGWHQTLPCQLEMLQSPPRSFCLPETHREL
uniref:Uncharacterized protein n=1 Tax=Seriola lalandi dorsalis TaxID=1841481 RepID=A0A3B4XAA2_SERLL